MLSKGLVPAIHSQFKLPRDLPCGVHDRDPVLLGERHNVAILGGPPFAA
jgi:hypothetical protein